MNRNIAYKRVSTDQQDTERQFHNSGMVFDLEFEEKLSGKNTDRPELKKCLSVLCKGDTLHVWEVSRLSRNLTDTREIVFSLLDRGVSIKFHKEGLEFVSGSEDGMKDAISKMMLNIMGSFAEFERSLICGRVKEGVAVAKSKGILMGAANPKYNRTDYSKKNASKKSYEFALTLKESLMSYRQKGLSFLTIAERFNEAGKTTNKGSEFKAMTVKRLCEKLEIK